MMVVNVFQRVRDVMSKMERMYGGIEGERGLKWLCLPGRLWV